MKAIQAVMVTGLLAGIALGGGCVASGHNALTLGGYRSVSVEVRVSDAASYDKDKLTQQLETSLKEAIRVSLSWSDGAKPVAKVLVNIVNFDEPPESERVVIGLPRQVSFVAADIHDLLVSARRRQPVLTSSAPEGKGITETGLAFGRDGP